MSSLVKPNKFALPNLLGKAFFLAFENFTFNKFQPQLEMNSDGEHCCTKFLFIDKTYINLPALVDDLRYVTLSQEEEDVEIQCKTVCPGLPLNNIIIGYKKARSARR